MSVWGLAMGSGEVILDFVPVGTADNLLHLALGIAGSAAGATGARQPAVPTGRASSAARGAR